MRKEKIHSTWLELPVAVRPDQAARGAEIKTAEPTPLSRRGRTQSRSGFRLVSV